MVPPSCSKRTPFFSLIRQSQSPGNDLCVRFLSQAMWAGRARAARDVPPSIMDPVRDISRGLQSGLLSVTRPCCCCLFGSKLMVWTCCSTDLLEFIFLFFISFSFSACKYCDPLVTCNGHGTELHSLFWQLLGLFYLGTSLSALSLFLSLLLSPLRIWVCLPFRLLAALLCPIIVYNSISLPPNRPV